MLKKNFYELDEIQDQFGMWIVVDDKGHPFSGLVIETDEAETIIYEGVHFEGRICGYEKRFHENGSKKSYEERYNNSPHGVARTWYENGTLKFDAEYRFGNLMKYKRFNEDGIETESYDIQDEPEKLESFNILVERIKKDGLEEKWNSIFT